MKNSYSNRILLIGPQIGYASGISTHIQSIKDSELKNKYKFIVFSAGSGENKETLKQIVNRLISGYIDFIKIANKFDLAHINTALTTKALLRDSVFCFLCKLFRKKILVQFHSGNEIENVLKNKLDNIILKIIFSMSDKCVFLLDKEVNMLKRIFCNDKIRKIYNGIDVSAFEGIKKKFDRKSFLSLGYIGRVNDKKGIFESLKVIKILTYDLHIPVKYYIAGVGPLIPFLMDITKQFKLENHVIFLGLVQNYKKQEFWQQIDIFLFLTNFPEGIPYAFLESLASGTPVITTRSGGLNEIVDLIPESIIVESNEIEHIANLIKELYYNIDQLDKISVSLKKRAKNLFSFDVMLKNIDKCYQEII